MTPRLRSNVLAARDQLTTGRQQIRAQHDRGLKGVQICGRLTSLVDSVVMQLYEAALADMSAAAAEELRRRVVLVAHSGYGRRQLAPHSDIDLMVLHEGRTDSLITEFARRLTQDIFDCGEKLGQSVRTPSEAIQLAKQDPQIGTSLLESRLLIGASNIHEQFVAAYAKTMERRRDVASRQFINARRQERAQFGETVFLLEPNIKRSRGGLRDLHLLRWLWFLKTGVAEPDRLYAMGVISKFDYRRLYSARDFLLRVRNDMHFHHAGACDLLSRAEQVRLAEKFGRRGTKGLHPAEQFMREYFHHTDHIWRLAHRISELIQPVSTVKRVLEPVFARSIEKDYRLGMREIAATQLGQGKLRSRIDEVLRLVDLARLYDKWISQETWYVVYRAAPDYPRNQSFETLQRFLALIENPLKLGELLRRLHELGVLERIIPEFSHARCLLQFNQYHKYTVDEHCILAVEEATRFADRSDTLGATYRQLKRKSTLHLALLLHDLGKGHEEDHSEIGERIACETADRFQLPAQEADALVFLVHKHLRMSHLAFRRNTNQETLIHAFAQEVGNADRLRLLYVLSCADLSAVGPGVLNKWKEELLTGLFNRTLHALEPQSATPTRRDKARLQEAVWKLLDASEGSDPWFAAHFNALPESFIAELAPPEIVAALRKLRDLPPRGGCAWARYSARTDTVEFTSGVDQGSGRGVFSGMAGALSSRGMEILSAETATLPNNLLLQRYVVQDRDFSGEPPQERLEAISRTLVDSIDAEKPPKIRSLWGGNQAIANAALSNLPQEVRVNSRLEEDCTIVEVFTIDRHGLLYELARALHDLQLVIRFAKIGTYLDQVVDVFYVTERDGSKPESADRITEIEARLSEIIGPATHST